MAKFYLELTYPGAQQDRYLVMDHDDKVWLEWEYITGANFVCVNSQLRTDIIEETFYKEVDEFMARKGLTKVRINMVRYNEHALSLSGRYTVYRRWDVKPLLEGTRNRWVPLSK